MLIDTAEVIFKAGDGGNGKVSFRKNMKGPDGGNGGRGGHVIIRGNKQLWTLLHLKYFKHVIAENGKGGSAADEEPRSDYVELACRAGEGRRVRTPAGLVPQQPGRRAGRGGDSEPREPRRTAGHGA